MTPDRRRTLALVGLFAALSIVTLLLLRDVLATVFFAITIAYVLYPVRHWLSNRGLSRRLAAALATTLAFVVGLLLLAPLGVVLYLRRDEIVAFLRDLPDAFTLSVAEFTYTVELGTVIDAAVREIGNLALDLARAAPVLALKAFLFTLLVYALLLRPDRLRNAFLRPVPSTYHGLAETLHERTRDTLYALYVLQAATAFGTFCIAFVVFTLLGYDSSFTLAALSGILQFVPVVGPSVLVVGLAAIEVAAGDVAAAVAVTVLGLLFVGFLPDATIRPRLARYTTGLPGSLYFVGFTGGVLSVGVVGVIAGPLAVALLAEVAGQLAEENGSVQERRGTN